MTISKSKPNYSVDRDPPPRFVSIGVSLFTVEEHTFEQDGRAISIPVDDDITYITVPREVVYLPCGGVSYDIIASPIVYLGMST